jgi:membrane protease YdiL (CAAX protease family)
MRRHRDLALSVAAGVLTVVSAVLRSPLSAGAAAFAAVLLLNYASLRSLVRSRLLSRTLRAVPFLAPLLSVGWPTAPSAPAWVWIACVLPIAAWLAVTAGRIQLNLSAARLAPSVTGKERAAGLLPYLLAGPTQEYLHRGVLLTGFAAITGPFAIVLSTATFIAEHLFTAHRRGRATLRELAIWAAMGVLFGTVVYLRPSALAAAIAAHTLFNLPNMAAWIRRPSRRTRRSRSTASAVFERTGTIPPEYAQRIARVEAAVRQRLGRIPDTATAVLAGSIIDGYGNPNSDIDVTVLARKPWDPASGLLRPDRVFQFDGKSVELHFVENERIDLEIHPLAKVDALIKRLSDYDPGDRRAPHIDPFAFQLLHQLRIGVPVAGDDELRRIRAEVPWHAVTEILRLRNESFYTGHAEDAAGAIKAGDAPTAVLASRRALGAATDCLIAAYGHTNPKEKWRYRKLDDLGLSDVKSRCLAAECDPDPQLFIAGSRRRLLLAQELVSLAGQRTAAATS